jgi:hypothetical protein
MSNWWRMNRAELKKVRKTLTTLVGLPLWAAGRAFTLEWFQFGDRITVQNHRGEPKEVGTYALHVDCAWRLIGPKGIIVGSRDKYYSAVDPENQPEDFNWDVQGANRCDVLINAFFSKLPRAFKSVTSVELISAAASGFGLATPTPWKFFLMTLLQLSIGGCSGPEMTVRILS